MASDQPLLLAFDTAAAHCAAVLVRGDAVLARRDEAMDRGQAERLLPMLEEMLAEAGIGWSAVEGLAICTGPGNFTGLRLSVAAARGLALALGVPAVGVTIFEALADRPGPVLATAQDRRGGYFAQVFNDGRALGEAVVAGDAAAIGPLPAGTKAVGFDAAAIAAARGLAAGDCVARADPLVLARIAARRLAHSTPPAPLYLRAADAMPPSEVPPRILDDA